MCERREKDAREQQVREREPVHFLSDSGRAAVDLGGYDHPELIAVVTGVAAAIPVADGSLAWRLWMSFRRPLVENDDPVVIHGDEQGSMISGPVVGVKPLIVECSDRRADRHSGISLHFGPLPPKRSEWGPRRLLHKYSALAVPDQRRAPFPRFEIRGEVEAVYLGRQRAGLVQAYHGRKLRRCSDRHGFGPVYLAANENSLRNSAAIYASAVPEARMILPILMKPWI